MSSPVRRLIYNRNGTSMPKRSRSHLLFAIVGLSILALFLAPRITAAVAPDPVTAAWQRARATGSYHFGSDVVQVTTPSATLANVGRTSHEDRLRLEGETDLHKR